MRAPGAIWRPPQSDQGNPRPPTFKTNPGVNSVEGVVCHSMVGYFAGAMVELDRPARQASWHFSIRQDGTVYQHYETEARCWHAGSAYNQSTIGIEHEGGVDPLDEPLTVEQRDASVELVRWLAASYGFPLVRKVGLWEHNEVSDEITLCPSHRIPWEFYTEEAETVLLECGDAPAFQGGSSYRLYQLAIPPIWVTLPVQAQVLKDLSGPPTLATWGQLRELGAK